MSHRVVPLVISTLRALPRAKRKARTYALRSGNLVEIWYHRTARAPYGHWLLGTVGPNGRWNRV